MAVIDPLVSRSFPTQAAAVERPSPIRRRLLIAAIVLGLALRFVLAAICWGTNDANTFAQFGYYITRDGLMQTYRSDTWLNHPPLPAVWSEVVWRLTRPARDSFDTTSPIEGDNPHPSQRRMQATPGRYFSAVFKIPALLADCATALLLYLLWRGRAGKMRGLAVAAMYAWALDAILVSGYHCNTDSVYAFLCLLCVYMLQDRRAHFLAGLALAAAINVKLTPVLLILPLLLWHRSWKQARKFVLGLAIGVIPFVPVFMHAGKSFYHNAISYKSNPDNWGITCILMQRDNEPGVEYEFVAKYHPWATFYFNSGRYVVLALTAGWGLLARSRRRNPAETRPLAAPPRRLVPPRGAARGTINPTPVMAYFSRGPAADAAAPFDAYRVAAVTLAIFLFFTPGFGVQYTVLVVPLLFAVWPGMASAYAFVAGLFLTIVYWAHWPGHRWPPNSQFAGMFPRPTRIYSLTAWGLLGWFLLQAVCTRRLRLGHIGSKQD